MLLTIVPLNPINALDFLLYKHDAQVVSQTVHLLQKVQNETLLQKKEKRNKSTTNKATKTTTRKTMHNKNKAK